MRLDGSLKEIYNMQNIKGEIFDKLFYPMDDIKIETQDKSQRRIRGFIMRIIRAARFRNSSDVKFNIKHINAKYKK